MRPRLCFSSPVPPVDDELPCALVSGSDAVVSESRGSDDTGDGSQQNPWQTISFALSQVAECASESRPIIIRLEAGTYEETVSLRDYITLEGASESAAETRIYPKVAPGRGGLETGDSVVDATAGLGGNNVLRNLTIEIESGAPQSVALLKVIDVPIEAENVVFNGRNRPGSIGVDISSLGSSDSFFAECRFTRLENGVFAVDTSANFTRNTFDDIQGTAVFVRPPDGVGGAAAERNPLFGDQGREQSTGLNTFMMRSINGGSGLVIDTGVTELGDDTALLQAERNNWDGADSEEEIVSRVSANVQVGARVGGAIVGTTLVVQLLDADAGGSIEGATVTALQSGSVVQTLSEGSRGIYVFPVLEPGSYTVTASRDGYEDGEASVVASDAIESVDIPLSPEVTPPSLEDIAGSLLDGFSTADTNSDGVLDYTEASAQESSLTQNQFNTLDSNGDGFVTTAELDEYTNPPPPPPSCNLNASNATSKVRQWIADFFLLGVSLLVMTTLGRGRHPT